METRKKILKAALELFIKHGLYGVSTSKISKTAGVSTGILFHYFNTKENLIIELYVSNKVEYMSGVLDQLTDDLSVEEKFNVIWESRMKHCSKKALICKFCNQIEYSPFLEKVKTDERLANIHDRQYQIFRDGREQNIIKDLPVDYLLRLFTSMEVSTIRYLNAHPEYHTDSDFLESTWQTVWSAIKV